VPGSQQQQAAEVVPAAAEQQQSVVACFWSGFAGLVATGEGHRLFSKMAESLALAVEASPSGGGGYRYTAQHKKTLDVLASVKQFDELTEREIKTYCELVKAEHSCKNAKEASEAMHSRYGWDTDSQLEVAWSSLFGGVTETTKKNASTISSKAASASKKGHESDKEKDVVVEEKEEDEDEEEDGDGETSRQKVAAKPTSLSSFGYEVSANSVPVTIKNNVWAKNALICEFDDADLTFVGDSGAIGRLSVDDTNSFTIDLKGRQYEGTILPGPTVMLLNLAPPVGQQVYKQVARVELLTNEFCHLEFTKDVLGSMMGHYTGDGMDDLYDQEENGDDEEDERQNSKSSKKKKRASKQEDNEDGTSDEEEEREKKKGKKAPKISTITNRIRKATTKSKGKGKKVVKKK